MKIYHISEEPGCLYYATNDTEGRYFPCRDAIEIWDEAPQEFKTKAEAITALEKIIGRKQQLDENPDDALFEWAEENNIEYASFHEYEVIDD